MNWILAAFTVIYAIFSVIGVVVDIKDKRAVWMILVDAIASAVGVAGLVCFQMHVSVPFWWLALLFLIVGSLYIAVVDLQEEWNEDPRPITIVAAVGSCGFS